MRRTCLFVRVTFVSGKEALMSKLKSNQKVRPANLKLFIKCSALSQFWCSFFCPAQRLCRSHGFAHSIAIFPAVLWQMIAGASFFALRAAQAGDPDSFTPATQTRAKLSCSRRIVPMRNYDFQNSDFQDGFLDERKACVAVHWILRDNTYFLGTLQAGLYQVHQRPRIMPVWRQRRM